jgi:hypothetical protein
LHSWVIVFLSPTLLFSSGILKVLFKWWSSIWRSRHKMAIVSKNYLAKFGLWTNYELQILNQLSIYVWLHTENQIYKSGKKLLFFLSQQVIKTLQNHFNSIFYLAFRQTISSGQNGDYYWNWMWTRPGLESFFFKLAKSEV